MAMIVSEELGLKTEMIQIENADTGTTQYATPSGGSKTVPSDGPAVREAAVAVKQNLLKMAAEDMKVSEDELRITLGEIISTKDNSKKKKITEISQFKQRGVIMGVGHKRPNPKDKAINPFGAQFCEVKVNTKTGEMEIVNFLASHDSGRVMDRLTYDNQVFGGITMGIGFGTTEERILDSNQTGKLCNKNWHDYKLPTALDVPPDMRSEPIDLPDEEANSIGAKGLGEPVTIPTAAAIANALYDATGIRITKTPINPIQLSKLLAEKKGGK
jgi:xanthine dehydrogenase YagR molybdenum-binding subunit